MALLEKGIASMLPLNSANSEAIHSLLASISRTDFPATAYGNLTYSAC